MATADYWSSADLKGIAAGGLINEDVMQKIWDISQIPLPFTDLLTDGGKVNNSYTEWTQDSLGAPNLANAAVDGDDAGANAATGGKRVGNHTQISTMTVEVTQRAQESDTIGRSNELAYQLMMRQQELRRDVEAISLSNQASVADNGDNVAGKVGAFGAWLETNTNNGTGTDGGFNTSTKVVDAPTPGDRRALSEVMLKDAVEAAYLSNGNVTTLMSVPQVIRRLNTYLFGSSANIAKPTANVAGSGGGVDGTAQGYINVLVTDFGTSLKLIPNRLQQVYADDSAADAANVYLIDPSQVAFAYLQGYQTHPIAKLGLADRRQISVDWTLKVYNEKAHAVIRDINPTAAVVSGA